MLLRVQIGYYEKELNCIKKDGGAVVIFIKNALYVIKNFKI